MSLLSGVTVFVFDKKCGRRLSPPPVLFAFPGVLEPFAIREQKPMSMVGRIRLSLTLACEKTKLL
jgi:hypothetical protein